MYKKALILIVVSILWGANVYADPVISSVSGTLSNGSTITISGSSFGSKASAVPSKWDNFNSGTNGATISGWTSAVGSLTPPRYSNEDLRTGTGLNFKVVHGPRTDTSSSSQGYCDLRQTLPSGFTRAYLSFWVRWNWGPYTGSATDFQSKFWRVCESYPMESGDSSISNFNWYRGSNYLQYNDGSTAKSTSDMGGYANQQWMRVEAELSMGTPNTADGVIRIRYSRPDGSPIATVVNMNRQLRTSTSQIWKMIKIGDWLGNVEGDTSDNVQQVYYVDDVYFDTTWQRVEIGDKPTFAACTHREIQIPNVWNDGSISVKVNRGSFSSGTAYLYVVDASGTANASGYPITLGTSSGDTTAPVHPTGLSVTILP